MAFDENILPNIIEFIVTKKQHIVSLHDRRSFGIKGHPVYNQRKIYCLSPNWGYK